MDTIIACSTSLESNAALAVLRIDGFDDLFFLSKFLKIDPNKIVPNKAHLTDIFDDSGSILDQVIVVFFAAPNSYTGNNLLELSVHGNKLNVKRIINSLIARNICRQAKNGEFTHRALLNKKINLTQVEGLELLLNAQNPFMLDAGHALLNGDLNRSYFKLYELIHDFRLRLELLIDFSEDVGEEELYLELKEKLVALSSLLGSLAERCSSALNAIFTPTVVIFGAPNSGKSSLFNCLLNDERAIVSSIKGTTRDFLTEYFTINDVDFRLIDTAGLRGDSYDEIEHKGIIKSTKLIGTAFFKILLVNPFDNLDISSFLAYGPDLVIFTHSDLEGFDDAVLNYRNKINHLCVGMSLSGSIGPDVSGSIGPDISGSIGPDISGSIEIPRIKSCFLRDFIYKKYDSLIKDRPILVERQRSIIVETNKLLVDFGNKFYFEKDIGILSSEFQKIERSASELVGIISNDDILTSIFKNFCIGK